MHFVTFAVALTAFFVTVAITFGVRKIIVDKAALRKAESYLYVNGEGRWYKKNLEAIRTVEWFIAMMDFFCVILAILVLVQIVPAEWHLSMIGGWLLGQVPIFMADCLWLDVRVMKIAKIDQRWSKSVYFTDAHDDVRVACRLNNIYDADLRNVNVANRIHERSYIVLKCRAYRIAMEIRPDEELYDEEEEETNAMGEFWSSTEED